jgi:hypothetical protein
VSLARDECDRRPTSDGLDRSLALAAAAGGHAAFGQLMVRQRPALLQVSVRLTRDPAVPAEDCAQEACLLACPGSAPAVAGVIWSLAERDWPPHLPAHGSGTSGGIRSTDPADGWSGCGDRLE